MVSQNYLSYFKHVFVCITLVCTVIALNFLYKIKLDSNLAVPENETESVTQSQFEEDFPYKSLPNSFSEEILNQSFDGCLFMPDILHQYSSNNPSSTRSGDIKISNYIQTLTEDEKFQKFPLFDVLSEFTDMIKTRFDIETVILEPSILFCMIKTEKRNLLVSRNFTIDNYLKSKKILTLGIKAQDVEKLTRRKFLSRLKGIGYGVELVKAPMPHWMRVQNTVTFDNHFISHLFFKRREWILHLVVIFKRATYFWHAGIPDVMDYDLPPSNDLFFIEADSAYETFNFTPLGFKDDLLSSIHIPSNPLFFLFEMKTSRFMECNMTIVNQFIESQATATPEGHSWFTNDQFNFRTVVAIQELKARFNPLLIHFFTWSGTMLGWFRQCDIIPYTGDIDFAAYPFEVDTMEHLLELFDENGHITLVQRMGFLEAALELRFDCHDLRVDLFFIYPEHNGSHCAGHRPSRGYWIKYFYTPFTLCSAELLRQKVLVPCETESLITPEYGPDWMTPHSYWYYETSIWNRGPNIYWSDEDREKAYNAIV